MSSTLRWSAMWRSFLALLVLSCAVQSISFGDLLGSRKSERNRVENEKQKPIGRPHPGFSGSDDGSSQVHEAISHLQSINVSNKAVKAEKKSGFVGTTAYYAKEAFVLLFMNTPNQDALDTDEQAMQLAKPLSTAVKLLEEAAQRQQNPEALYLLAEMNFWGNYSHPRSYKQAFHHYRQLAELTGNATAQQMLGFFYATGMGNVVERDQAKAQLYHTVAAEQGNIRSEMTLAFRSYAGIGTRKDCDVATKYYKRVADKAIAFSRSGPPGGQVLPRDSYRLADEIGGVYGEGASFYSSGYHGSRGHPAADGDDMVEYLELLTRTKDPRATFTLAKLYYEGDKTLKRNLRLANFYFTKMARMHWDEDDEVLPKDKTSSYKAKLASKAAAYIGRMYLRGEGTKQDFKKAEKWFRLGLQAAEPFCQYELGLMYLLGLGVRRDPVLASDYFKEAAMQDWPAAQARLGRLFLDQGDLTTAQRYFEFAARHGHIEALYHLAEINDMSVEGRERNCGVAQSFYKHVAEKAEPIHSDLADANRMYETGDIEGAVVRYMMAAEQGYEAAQANVAWLLDEQKSILDIRTLIPWLQVSTSRANKALSILRNAGLALIYWTRSARQWNADSAVKMGDAYFSGLGLQKPDVEKALACYQTAADAYGSAQANWNLGWMHENGIGAEQDFHLAKRYYDLALEAAQEAYLPVKLALWKLRIRSRWNDWIGGGVKSMEYEDEDNNEQKYKTWREWLANFLEDEHPYQRRAGEQVAGHAEEGEEGYAYEWDDGSGSIGVDEYYADEIDDDVFETLLMLGLGLLLTWLIWYRQQRQQAQQRQQQQQPAPQQQGQRQDNHHQQQQQVGAPGAQPIGGPPPPPNNDPNFNAWGVGGVGH